MPEGIRCARCNIFLGDGSSSLNGEHFCTICLSTLPRCMQCGSMFHDPNPIRIGHDGRETYVCSTCVQRAGGAVQCPRCGGVSMADSRNGQRVQRGNHCFDCEQIDAQQRRREEERNRLPDVLEDIGGYHRTEVRQKHGIHLLKFGFENELNIKSGKLNRTEAGILVKKCKGALECKRDSTLPSNSFEIATYVIGTVDYWSDPNNEVINSIAEVAAAKSNNCGMHIHASRAGIGFSESGRGWEAHARKLIALFHHNEAFFRVMSGRKAGSYRHSLRKELKLPKIPGSHDAAFCQTRRTLEWRIFLGTNKPNRIRSNIEMYHALIEYTRLRSWKQLDLYRFIRWVQSQPIVYKNFLDTMHDDGFELYSQGGSYKKDKELPKHTGLAYSNVWLTQKKMKTRSLRS